MISVYLDQAAYMSSLKCHAKKKKKKNDFLKNVESKYMHNQVVIRYEKDTVRFKTGKPKQNSPKYLDTLHPYHTHSKISINPFYCLLMRLNTLDEGQTVIYTVGTGLSVQILLIDMIEIFICQNCAV